jgi:hypothetical protein
MILHIIAYISEKGNFLPGKHQFVHDLVDKQTWAEAKRVGRAGNKFWKWDDIFFLTLD